MFPICRRCGKPIKKYAEDVDIFEGMHWLCFHLEFEHGEYDPDEPCDDPSCPWNRISGNDKLIINHVSTDVGIKSYENRSALYFTIIDREDNRLPSINFRIQIDDENYGILNKNYWFENNEIEKFSNEISRMLKNEIDTCKLESMSPNEFVLVIKKIDSKGHYVLKYLYNDFRYIEDVRFETEVTSGFGVEYQHLDDFSKYLLKLTSL